jgi:hypothetical protein
MRKNTRLSVAATFYMLILLASQEIAMSQESSQLVDTGVIFSVEQLERSGADRVFWVTPPFWIPSPEQVALLETQLKPYLGRVKHPKAKAIAARLASYKRQYFGYTDGGKRWILVNGFCEGYWKKEDTWRDRVVLVLDGGRCFFKVRYDPSSSQFEKLEINGEA